MAEYTVRNQKTNPVLTFRARTLDALLSARPEASSLAIEKLRRDYKVLTGREFEIADNQLAQLLRRYGADSAGMWKSAVLGLPPASFEAAVCFRDGFLRRPLSPSVTKSLEVAQAFYELLLAARS